MAEMAARDGHQHHHHHQQQQSGNQLATPPPLPDNQQQVGPVQFTLWFLSERPDSRSNPTRCRFRGSGSVAVARFWPGCWFWFCGSGPVLARLWLRPLWLMSWDFVGWSLGVKIAAVRRRGVGPGPKQVLLVLRGFPLKVLTQTGPGWQNSDSEQNQARTRPETDQRKLSGSWKT